MERVTPLYSELLVSNLKGEKIDIVEGLGMFL